MKNKLILENCEYYFHPKFKGYAASLDGYVVHAVNQEVTPGVMDHNGYMQITVDEHWRNIYVHDFVWECFHGLLKYGDEVKHINKQRDDNRLENLKLQSSKEIVIKVSTSGKVTYV